MMCLPDRPRGVSTRSLRSRLDRRRRRRAALPLALAAVLALSGCAFSSSGSDDDPDTVVLVTHDSWAMKKSVLADFEKQTGYTLKVRANGDAGALTNKLVLTKDHPLGDVVFGIDNTFASRAADSGILQAYAPSKQPAGASSYALSKQDGGSRLTPIDYGDVCVNVDDTWFARHHQQPPRTLDDLTRKAYANQLVVPGPPTSSPGLAFLLTTIAAKGEGSEGQPGWQDYWRKLVANGVKVDAGWSNAYEVDFTAGGGKGDRPIVLSYSSSIPFTIPKGQTRPTTSALLDTCFRQVEYAGVLTGAHNTKGARAFVDFMQGKEFQRELPEQMYVYPVSGSVALPADWARWAKVAPHPWTVPAKTIATHRSTWLRQWRDVASR